MNRKLSFPVKPLHSLCRCKALQFILTIKIFLFVKNVRTRNGIFHMYSLTRTEVRLGLQALLQFK